MAHTLGAQGATRTQEAQEGGNEKETSWCACMVFSSLCRAVSEKIRRKMSAFNKNVLCPESSVKQERQELGSAGE